MLNLTYNWFNNKDAQNKDVCSVRISSEDGNNLCFNVLREMIDTLFPDSCVVFKAVGLPMHIDDIRSSIQSANVYYCKGDADKFFIRNYPLYIAQINKNHLNSILYENWSNAIHEERYIYILKEHNLDVVMNHLKSRNSTSCILQDYACAVIENVPEFGTDNAFVLACNKQQWDLIYPLLRIGM